MCGGFAIVYNISIYSSQFGVDEGFAKSLTSAFNVRPTDEHVVIAGDNHRLVPMRWGLIPSWAKESTMAYKTINARLETVEQKASYKQPLRSKRCLVPASGYFEWVAEKDGKQPYFIRPADHGY